jgi:hypothetical protein
LGGLHVRGEWGDNEGSEKLNMVFHVCCVLYAVSDVGDQDKLVAYRWVDAKGLLRNMSSSLAMKKLDVVGVVSSNSGTK